MSAKRECISRPIQEVNQISSWQDKFDKSRGGIKLKRDPVASSLVRPALLLRLINMKISSDLSLTSWLEQKGRRSPIII